MVQPYISEKEFEFAFDYELISNVGANNLEIYMPTAARESQEGFDAEFTFNTHSIRTSLFFQFKKVEEYSKPRSACGDPFNFSTGSKFRYKLHKQKYYAYHAQHNILKDLSNKGEHVFYASPTFVERRSLLRRLRDGSVIAGSRIFDLHQFPLLPNADSEDHYVYCTDAEDYGFFCSEPYKLEKTDLMKLIIGSSELAKMRIDEEKESEAYFKSILQNLLEAVTPEYKPKKYYAWEKFTSLQKITEILSDKLPDTSLIIILSKEERPV